MARSDGSTAENPPRPPGGKVDRKALREEGGESRPPRNPSAQRCANQYAELSPSWSPYLAGASSSAILQSLLSQLGSARPCLGQHPTPSVGAGR